MKSFRDFGIDLPDSFPGDRKVICPQCSHTRKKPHEPCLSVNGEKKTWLCHNCGWSGSLHEHSEYPKQERKTYSRPAPETVRSGIDPRIVDYFKGRGISERTLATSKVFSTMHYLAGTGTNTLCFAFPYYRDGELVNVKYRDARKNMTQEKNPEPCLWNIDSCHEAATIYITEGEIDALSLIECGYKTAVSVDKGAPNAKDANAAKKLECVSNCMERLKNADWVVLVTDKDEPGMRLEKELIEAIGSAKCKKTVYPQDCKDINDVLVKYGPEGVIRVIDSATPCPVPGLHCFSEFMDRVENLYRNGICRGLSTGWPEMDEIYTLKTGTLNIITGLPQSGKSEFMNALIVNTIRLHSWRWAVFTPEMMPPESLASNFIEKITAKPFFGRKESKVTSEEISRAMNMLDQSVMLIDVVEDENMNLDRILGMFRVCVIRDNVKGVLIDPWNWLESCVPPGESIAVYTGKMLKKIISFARTYDVWFGIVVHPRKPEKDKKTGKYPIPTLNDCSGSSEFNNKADYGISLYRDARVKDNLVQCHVVKAKNKYVAKANYKVDFEWNYQTGIFTPHVPPEEPESGDNHRYGPDDCPSLPYKD